MTKGTPTKESTDSKTIEKGLPLKPDPYVEEMKVWLKQREHDTKACRFNIAQSSREIKYLRCQKLAITRAIASRQEVIRLEQRQLHLIQQSVREADKQLRKYVKDR